MPGCCNASLFAKWGYRALPWPSREVQEAICPGRQCPFCPGLVPCDRQRWKLSCHFLLLWVLLRLPKVISVLFLAGTRQYRLGLSSDQHPEPGPTHMLLVTSEGRRTVPLLPGPVAEGHMPTLIDTLRNTYIAHCIHLPTCAHTHYLLNAHKQLTYLQSHIQSHLRTRITHSHVPALTHVPLTYTLTRTCTLSTHRR